MVDLVRHLREFGYSERLFAFTSMYELIIGLYPELEHGIETVHVFYDGSKQGYVVRYYATPTKEPEVERFYPREIGLSKFVNFIGYLKW